MSDIRRLNQAGTFLVRLLRAERSPVPLLLVAIATFGLFSALSPKIFPITTNIQAMGFQLPEVGLLGLAVSLSMITAGIDLSVVGIANLAAVTMGEVYKAIGPSSAKGGWGMVLLGAAVALAVGVVCGAVNGLLIGRLGITAILVTLSTGYLFGGLALAWTGGTALEQLPGDLLNLGTQTIAAVPLVLIIFVAAAAVVAVLLNWTRFGLRLVLVGANATAARMSGVRQSRSLMGTYVVSGLLAAVAGIVFTARTASVTSTYGSSYVLLAVVIAVLAGVDPSGGFGTVSGVVLATVILQMVQSGFTDLRFSQFFYQVAQGVILIGVLAVNVSARRWRVSWLGRRRREPPGLTSAMEQATVASDPGS